MRSVSGIFGRERFVDLEGFVGFIVEPWIEVEAEERAEVGLMVNEEAEGELAFEIDFECRRICNLM